MLNHDVNNPIAVDKGTPMNANFLACSADLPAGENYAPNSYYSKLTNEAYSWHYNSNNVHHIQRINGSGDCEIIYTGSCLELSIDPKAEITQFRAILDMDYLCNKIPGGKLKRLIWTDGTETPMGCIDVESAIATNFFTTPFFDTCPNPCSYIQLCVPEIKGCLVGEYIPFTDADKNLSNTIIDRGLKFACRHIYYDQRANELSDFSTLYYQNAKGCFDNSEGFARCIKFRVPVGNPQVEKIEFYFSEDGGLTWFLYETIEKYKQYNSNQQYWYQRDLSEQVSGTYSEDDCSFDYIFCNDKQRIPIDPKLLTRVLNPIPRQAQCLFKIKDSIAVSNYVVGNCPIDKNEVDKFEINVSCAPLTSCSPEMAKVTVRAVVYNGQSKLAGYVYRSGGAVGEADDPLDLACFGLGIKQYEQAFTGKVRDFMPYIEATNYQGIMEQWQSTPNFNSTKKVGILSGVLSQDEIDRLAAIIQNGDFFYQEYIFNVPKGTKGFVRIASHYQTSALGANQNTSTQVLSMLSTVLGNEPLKSYNGATDLTDYDDSIKELYFDTCDGDFDNFDAFIISDIIYAPEYAYSGYITDKNKQPVEGTRIYANGGFKSTTDFNGFYFFPSVDSTESITIDAEQNCTGAFQTVDSFGARSFQRQMSRTNHEISVIGYTTDWYAKVNISVKDCNNLPVRGIRVAMSGSKYKVTDADGIAHFKLRNYYTRNREIVSVVVDKGNCFSYDCSNNCNPCMPSNAAFLLGTCFQNTPEYSITQSQLINTGNLIANKRGLKDGGNYPFGIIAKGSCGKVSAVYPIRYISIPKMQETGGITFCDFSFNANGMSLPTDFDELLIVRGVNLNPYYLQWIVDSFELTTDGKIKITIQSLNDYNKSFNFKTNTVYQYLSGDRVEFKKNGDGIIFDSATNGILNYAILSPFNDQIISGVTTDATFFNQIIIVDDGKLDGLKEGAIIEIQPQIKSTETLTYFGICATIPVVNGQVSIQSGTFETFDTYLVNRQIGKYSAQLFSHNFPSDFWGSYVDNLNYITDIGRAYFVNSYENEKRYERNISVNAPNQLNYFGDFVKTLDAEEQGYITAVSVKDDKIGIAICKNDNFLFEISDDFLRVSSNGIVIAAPVDSIISNPVPKIRGEYGCSYEDIGSIYFGDSFVFYCDSQNNAAIMHNYSVAQMCGLSVNKENGNIESSCNSFFQRRMRQKANFNKGATTFLDHYRWCVGQNKTNSVIHLTLKTLRLPGINNEKEVYAANNETILYNPLSDDFLGFHSATPENYSELELNTDEGCGMLMYQNSLPYITPINADKWNQFFGVSCDQLVGITINSKNKVVVPLSTEVQSKEMFFVHSVTTDDINFRSEIPAVRFKFNNDKWNAAFLNNINSRGGLYSGTGARSYFINVLFIKNNTLNLIYGSVNPQKQTSYNELDYILVKSLVSEQAGFEVNV